MRIGINARTLSTNTLRGWSRYTSHLIRELSFQNLDLYLFTDRPINNQWLEGANQKNIKIVEAKGMFYFHWEQWVLPSLCEKHRIDLLHTPVHYGLPLKGRFKKVITIHDAIEVAYYDKKMDLKSQFSMGRNYVRNLNRLSRFIADHVLTVSEFSKNDLIKHYNFSPEKVTVTEPAADSLFSKENVKPFAELKKKFDINKSYFFYMGGLEDRKNIDFLIRAFSQVKSPQKQLVIGGGSRSCVESFQKKYSEQLAKGELHFLGYIQEEWLPSLYYHARCFVYPSLYEGFGLQAVEAMKMECPVIASDRTSLPEVINNESALFDPESQESLYDKMVQLLEDDLFCNRLKDHSIKRAKDFSWKKMADQTHEVYSKLIS